MNPSVILRSILLASLLSFAAFPLIAQNPLPPPPVAAPAPEPRLFDFPGGTPADFVAAVDKAFGTQWSQIASIPEKARALRIPSIRMRVISGTDAADVFRLANDLTRNTPGLGEWMMLSPKNMSGGRRGEPTTAAALLYSVRPSPVQQPTEVRALSMGEVPHEKWNDFLKLLDESLAEVLPSASKAGAEPPAVNVRIHRDAAVLMITATKEHIERVETLATALRTGMAKAPGAASAASDLAPSKLVPLPGVGGDDVNSLNGVLTAATKAWTIAQEQQGGKRDARTHFTYLANPSGMLLVGPPEWIEFAQQVVGEWAANHGRTEEASLAQGLKARAFSVAGLPTEIVKTMVQEVAEKAAQLRVTQADFASKSGRSASGGAIIFHQAALIDELHVLLVTGNDAGIEFARSLIEETRSAAEKVKYVIISGAVPVPQRMVWSEDLTVLGLIAAVGGVQEPVKDTIRLTRGQETLMISLKEMTKDPKKDFKLQPGDRVEVVKELVKN